MSKPALAVLDRIEDGQAVLLIGQERACLPARLLPPDAKDGDWFLLSGSLEGGDLRLIPSSAETQARQARVADKLVRLRARRP